MPATTKRLSTFDWIGVVFVRPSASHGISYRQYLGHHAQPDPSPHLSRIVHWHRSIEARRGAYIGNCFSLDKWRNLRTSSLRMASACRLCAEMGLLAGFSHTTLDHRQPEEMQTINVDIPLVPSSLETSTHQPHLSDSGLNHRPTVPTMRCRNGAD